MSKRSGTPGFCCQCDRPSEYDSPDYLCRYCWADWWADGDEKEIKRVIRWLKRKYCPDPPRGVIKCVNT
jgi:hypothetical protein